MPLVAASVPAVGVPRPVILFVPIAIAPDMLPPDFGNLVATLAAIVVAKASSSPNAAAKLVKGV